MMRWNMSASGFEDEENKVSESLRMLKPPEAQNVQNATSAKAAEDPASIVRSDEAKAILAPLDSVTDADILLDVSENSSTHIAGSVVIPYMEFDVQAGVLKPVPEISKILGDAGISREDSVVIYGECLPCGGGPSVATYVYWMMKGLGHENVGSWMGRLKTGTHRDGPPRKTPRYSPAKSTLQQKRQISLQPTTSSRAARRKLLTPGPCRSLGPEAFRDQSAYPMPACWTEKRSRARTS